MGVMCQVYYYQTKTRVYWGLHSRTGTGNKSTPKGRTMIEGLKFQMPSDELRTHLIARIEHHKGRKAFYEQKVGELQAGGAEGMQYTGGDPIRALRDKSAEHQRQIELFKFMHDHVAPGEMYQLADTDLQRIEILGRGW